ncbi:MAG: HAMP domain-containing protein [Ardenticatenaceae bacterium]|nr:HAMP domain-containing protein [Ardenticatenaceae bacterium]
MRELRWHYVVGYLFLIIVVMISLGYSLTRPLCLGDADCVRRMVAFAAMWLIGLGLLFAILSHRQTIALLRQLIFLTQRIASGDTQARLLPQQSGEFAALIHAFNDLKDHLVGQIDALAEQQRQLALVFEYTADGVLILDRLSYVHLINPAALQLLKTSEENALRRSFAEVVRHHQLIELFQQCDMKQERQVQAFEVGNGRFLQATITPFQERGVRGYLVILQDMTAMRRLETVRRDFVSNVSHELRTPLASLRAVIETLQDGALEEPEVAERFLRRAVREVDTLTQMVEELLELSRIESGRVPLRLQATAVSDLVLLPLERLRDQAERGEVQLVLNLPGTLPLVLADAARVQQVISNLLHNAIKFTPPGGRVEVRAYPTQQNKHHPLPADDDTVTIEVKDSGIGISATDLPRIFERFYKSDRARTRSHGGTGLGLAIARHLVEAHNGRIWVKSHENEGSSFYFTLPLADA